MQAKVGNDIGTAAQLLDLGEVVAIPTETVYGLAANALLPEAVEKIFAIKNRPFSNPLILHFADVQAMLPYIHKSPIELDSLIQRFWPGPLTILFEKSSLVPEITNAGLPRVAVRVPDHQLTLELLKSLDYPLAAPSANPSGYISPTSAHHVLSQLGDKINYILDGGSCRAGLESTIVGLENNRLIVYRLGSVSVEDLSHHFNGIVEIQNTALNNKPLSPGMLPYHYAPRTPLKLAATMEEHLSTVNPTHIGVITYSWQTDEIPEEHVVVFDIQEDMLYAAHLIYEILFMMDQFDLDLILVQAFPEKDLGRTINDRLRRASERRITQI